MKKSLLSLFLAACTTVAFAQTNLTQAVDFTVTFTDGETFNLFDKLAEGKHVCIDFFFTTCGPCQVNQASYTTTFQNFGCNEGDVFFLSLENTVGDALTIVYEETYSGENAPPAASGTEGGGQEAVSLYNIGAFPTFILIAPDGEILEQDIWPLTNGAGTFTSTFEPYGIEQMVCATSVDEVANQASFSAYPSPAQDLMNVELSGFSGMVNIEVYNLVGEIVFNLTTNNSLEVIKVSNWAAGNYYKITSSILDERKAASGQPFSFPSYFS
jgi:hypothetical protein